MPAELKICCVPINWKMKRVRALILVVTMLLSGRYLLFSVKGLFDGVVVGNKPLTSDINHLRISINRDFNANPGQAVAVVAPQNVKRVYSLSGLNPFLIEICVKRVLGGVVSNFLCDSKIGDILNLEGPIGKDLILPEILPDRIILIGTGTGLAPFRALLTELRERKYLGQVILIGGAKNSESLPYLDDFKKIGTDLWNFEMRLAFSKVENKRYVQDAFSVDEAREWASGLIFICGGKSMGAEVVEKLKSAMGEEDFKEMKRSKRLRKEVY